jgi:outer membrane immunogenic protein
MFSNAAGSYSYSALGYTVGAGAEAMVTNNITARIEYRYTDYQKNDFNVGGANISRGYDEHSVKVGIGMKF